MRPEVRATAIVSIVIIASFAAIALLHIHPLGTTIIKTFNSQLNSSLIYVYSNGLVGNLTITSYSGNLLKLIEVKHVVLCPPNYVASSIDSKQGSVELRFSTNNQFYWWPSWLCSVKFIVLVPRQRLIKLISVNGTNGLIDIHGATASFIRIKLVNGLGLLESINATDIQVSIVNGVIIMNNTNVSNANVAVTNGVINSTSPIGDKYSLSVINGVVNMVTPINASISATINNGKLIMIQPGNRRVLAGSIQVVEGSVKPIVIISVVNGVATINES
ncbi:MAG: hypothetical protein ACP5NY_09245 [Thermocladium sp.]